MLVTRCREWHWEYGRKGPGGRQWEAISWDSRICNKQAQGVRRQGHMVQFLASIHRRAPQAAEARGVQSNQQSRQQARGKVEEASVLVTGWNSLALRGRWEEPITWKVAVSGQASCHRQWGRKGGDSRKCRAVKTSNDQHQPEAEWGTCRQASCSRRRRHAATLPAWGLLSRGALALWHPALCSSSGGPTSFLEEASVFTTLGKSHTQSGVAQQESGGSMDQSIALESQGKSVWL